MGLFAWLRSTGYYSQVPSNIGIGNWQGGEPCRYLCIFYATDSSVCWNMLDSPMLQFDRYPPTIFSLSSMSYQLTSCLSVHNCISCWAFYIHSQQYTSVLWLIPLDLFCCLYFVSLFLYTEISLLVIYKRSAQILATEPHWDASWCSLGSARSFF